MANKADGLISDSLSESVDNYTTGANVTVAAFISPAHGNTKVTLTNIPWSIRNVSGAAFTATLSVRDASPAGTVRASWDMLIANSASAQDTYNVSIKGVAGKAIYAIWDTFAASVTAKVGAVGWQQNSEL